MDRRRNRLRSRACRLFRYRSGWPAGPVCGIRHNIWIFLSAAVRFSDWLRPQPLRSRHQPWPVLESAPSHRRRASNRSPLHRAAIRVSAVQAGNGRAAIPRAAGSPCPETQAYRQDAPSAGFCDLCLLQNRLLLSHGETGVRVNLFQSYSCPRLISSEMEHFTARKWLDGLTAKTGLPAIAVAAHIKMEMVIMVGIIVGAKHCSKTPA